MERWRQYESLEMFGILIGLINMKWFDFIILQFFVVDEKHVFNLIFSGVDGRMHLLYMYIIKWWIKLYWMSYVCWIVSPLQAIIPQSYCNNFQNIVITTGNRPSCKSNFVFVHATEIYLHPAHFFRFSFLYMSPLRSILFAISISFLFTQWCSIIDVAISEILLNPHRIRRKISIAMSTDVIWNRNNRIGANEFPCNHAS